jgi:hypothetical protein
MISTLITATFLALLSTTTARSSLRRRGLPGAVYTCTSTDFGGDCQWTPPPGRCIIIGNPGIQSLGPDPDGYCILYEKSDCTGTQIQTVRFPGISSSIPTAGAFKCYANVHFELNDNQVVKQKGVDPRLAGGVGSAEREEHAKEIEQMEQDGFSQGLIGFNKRVYY